MGISIARSLLKLHNDSSLLITSTGEGRGTSFEMRLYVKPTSVGKDHPAMSSARSSVRQSGSQASVVSFGSASQASLSGPPTPRRELSARSSSTTAPSAMPPADEPARAHRVPTSTEQTKKSHPGPTPDPLTEGEAPEGQPGQKLTFPPDFCCLHVEVRSALALTGCAALRRRRPRAAS